MIWRRRGFWPSVGILAAQVTVAASTQLTFVPTAYAQQGAGVLTGKVVDATTKAPVADVVVTVSSTALQGEQMDVTDASGQFRIQNLPPGDYTIRYERETFRPYSRQDVKLRADVTLRVDAQLLPEAIKAEELVVVAQAPTVDVGSASQGLNFTSDFTTRIPVVVPQSRGGAVRSFEAVAEVVPGAKNDTYGVSVNGTTSPENSYVVDGVSTNNPAFGINASPLSVEFVKEVNVLAGGYMPEYGRSTGGILNVVTKQGSNEFHGGVWLNTTPGGLEGDRTQIRRDGSTIVTNPRLNHIGDLGAEVGGPIIKDKLWFYVGGQVAQTSYDLKRDLNRFILANPADPSAGYATEKVNGQTFNQTELIRSENYRASRSDYQVFGKLTWTVNPQNRVVFTAYATPSSSGGVGSFAIDPLTGTPEVGNIAGQPQRLATQVSSNIVQGTLKWTTESANKKLLLDTTTGVFYSDEARTPWDGTRLGSNQGLQSVPAVTWRRSPNIHPITDFENVPECDPAGTRNAVLCPVQTYATGGPGFLNERSNLRFQARSTLTYLAEFLGHHVAKAGVDFEYLQFDSKRGYTGSVILRESLGGGAFQDIRNYTFYTGPDETQRLQFLNWKTQSFTIGGFAQDSWSIMDKVTLNLGLRWDGQFLTGGDGQASMNLPQQWSPRVGLIWDPTQEGRSKIYANFARYYTTVPLNLMDRAGSAEPSVFAQRPRTVCDPTIQSQAQGACLDPNTATVQNPAAIDRRGVRTGGPPAAIVSNLEPQASDEFVAGGELDVIKNGRVGLFYTKRWMASVLEDMSRDQAATYFIGNPGLGQARDFPRATRDYDAFTVFFQKAFADDWIAQANYTLSFLRGNYEGLFRSDSGQLDPFITSSFDLPELTVNKNGPLPGDRTHEFKLFGSKDWRLPLDMLIQTGLSFRATSGAPTNYLGSHQLYGTDEIYILKSGEGNRLPWIYRVDAKLGYGFKWGKEQSITVTMDVFNLFNFQGVTARDQRYTTADVLPIVDGTRGDLNRAQPITSIDENARAAPLLPGQVNPNFGNPTQYQLPRQFRFGIRTTF